MPGRRPTTTLSTRPKRPKRKVEKQTSQGVKVPVPLFKEDIGVSGEDGGNHPKITAKVFQLPTPLYMFVEWY